MVATTNDEGVRSALRLKDAGVTIEGVADLRAVGADGRLADRLGSVADPGLLGLCRRCAHTAGGA